MSLPKLLATISIFLFVIIAIAALFKDKADKSNTSTTFNIEEAPLEIELDQSVQTIEPIIKDDSQSHSSEPIVISLNQEPSFSLSPAPHSSANLPEADRIEELFNKEEPKLPFVETIAYKSRVSWQKGRPAWLSDYAVYYKTSRHFIARGLNGKADYLKQNLIEGNRFNVFRRDKNISFQLIVDTSRCKMWFYCRDEDTHQTTLLKTYSVGLGRLDPSKASGLLTPLGKYLLGNKIAIYQPKSMGFHNGKKVEMITVFGTRWIPFEKEIADCTLPAKGFGIHGAPWILIQGSLQEDNSSIGKYESDGCIRMATSDMEELFAIIITKPTEIEILRDFSEHIHKFSN